MWPSGKTRKRYILWRPSSVYLHTLLARFRLQAMVVMEMKK